MNVPQLTKLGKLLKEYGVIDNEPEVMELVIMLPPPDFYFLDVVKFDDHISRKFQDHKTYSGSLHQYLVDKFGQDFWDKFENIALK